uniref:Uncharacterized protein n=1 Tax=Oryza punctata TaxID=4537 RepID=A0A0E0M378_ORYPU
MAAQARREELGDEEDAEGSDSFMAMWTKPRVDALVHQEGSPSPPTAPPLSPTEPDLVTVPQPAAPPQIYCATAIVTSNAG